MSHRPSSLAVTLIRTSVLVALGALARAQDLPAGFVAEPIASGWSSPVDSSACTT